MVLRGVDVARPAWPRGKVVQRCEDMPRRKELTGCSSRGMESEPAFTTLKIILYYICILLNT